MLERKTTWGTVWRDRHVDPSDPSPPDDDPDWILEAMAVDDGMLFWSWARYVDDDEPGPVRETPP